MEQELNQNSAAAVSCTSPGVRGRVAARSLACAAAFVCAFALSAPAALASPGFTHIDTTHGCHSYSVPTGFTTVTVEAVGAAGNELLGTPGGSGGEASGQVSITSGQELYLCVDVGGGSGANGGGGGGGASGVALGSDFSSPLVVGGGGGGAGGCIGADGGSAGQPVASSGHECKGTEVAGGGGGDNTTGKGGAGASQCGTAGSGSGSTASGPGSGGNGSGGCSGTDGGGGGGYYGGGGGAGDSAGGGGTDYCDTSSVTGCTYVKAGTGAQVVVQYLAAQTIAFPATMVTLGKADFSPASASSGLATTYTSPSGHCTVSNGGADVHLTGAGSCTVTANQAGDEEYAAATPVTQTFTIEKASPSISTKAASATVGAPMEDEATVEGRVYPQAGAQLVFKVYGPNDTGCAGAAAQTFTVSYPASGEPAVPSGAYMSTKIGAYYWTASYSGDANNEPASSACEASGETSTASKASPTVMTNASSATVGAAIEDEATVEGRMVPEAGATIEFKLYGPNDTGCTGAPVKTSTLTYPASGEPAVSSGAYTTSEAGAYYWTVSYSGDANNEPASSACEASGETSTVGSASPAISATAPASAQVGTPINDAARISAGYEPTGSILFTLYGPGDETCSKAPVFTETVEVGAGNGEYRSGAFTPSAAGTYRWVAAYSGDSNNEAIASGCGEASETVEVEKASPAITTKLSPSVVIGAALRQTANLSGGYKPAGSILFTLYGPGDETCSKAPVFTETVAVRAGNGGYGSGAFTPTAVGTYHWVYSYSGDANNAGSASSCGEAGETVQVEKATPTVATAASSATVGGSIEDEATVSGRVDPQAGAAIEFRLYGPNDSGCAGTPTKTFALTYPAAGEPTVSSGAFAAIEPGAYHWSVSYSGDANNNPASSACEATGETSTVAKITPTMLQKRVEAKPTNNAIQLKLGCALRRVCEGRLYIFGVSAQHGRASAAGRHAATRTRRHGAPLYGHGYYLIEADRARKIRIKLNKHARRALRHHHSITVKIVAVSDGFRSHLGRLIIEAHKTPHRR